MDNSIDTGDPWELGEQEQAPPAGGINPLAEGTGLFGKRQPATDEQPEEPTEEPAAGDDAALPEPALPEPIAAGGPAEDDEGDAIESALSELEAAESVAPDAATAADDDSFELIPPPAPDEIPPMYETYSPDLAAEMAEYVPAPTEEPEEPEAVIPPGPAEDGGEQFGFEDQAASDPVEEPVAAVPAVEDVVIAEPSEPLDEEPVIEEPVEPVEIEFGKPNVPEGSEMPTGKATQTVSEETMRRPALLTTDTVAGARIAPVDMVIAVESVGSPEDVADAMASVLDQLRDRCADAGGDVVVGVETVISSTGTTIMVTAAGTAVGLL